MTKFITISRDPRVGKTYLAAREEALETVWGWKK